MTRAANRSGVARPFRLTLRAARRAGRILRYGPALARAPLDARPFLGAREYRAAQRAHLARLQRSPEPRAPDACPLCGAAEAQPMFGARGRAGGRRWSFAVERCPACGLLYRTPRPEQDPHLAVAGRRRAPQALGRLIRGTLEAFAPWFDDGGGRRLLDLGCGDGSFLETAHALGFDTFGVDRSKGSVERARARKGGASVSRGSPFGSTQLARGGFDVITMWSVLSQLARPLEDLYTIRTLLAPDGVLLLTTENADSLLLKRYGSGWSGFAPGRLVFHTPRTLEAALLAAGFSEVVFRPSYGDAVEQGRVAPEHAARVRAIIDETGQSDLIRAVALNRARTPSWSPGE